MTKITFVNGTTPALNATNLNQMQTNVENAINALTPVVLYSDTSGTTGTVTLSETSANFRMLEIFYIKGGMCQSAKVFSPNGKKVSLILGYVDDTTFAQIQAPRVNIQGNKITKTNPGMLNFGANYDGIATGNEVAIYAVIGYR